MHKVQFKKKALPTASKSELYAGIQLSSLEAIIKRKFTLTFIWT